MARARIEYSTSSGSGVAKEFDFQSAGRGTDVFGSIRFKPNDPVGNVEKRKDLRRDLDEQPGHYDVGDCDAVNTTPFQLGRKGAEIHGFGSTSF